MVHWGPRLPGIFVPGPFFLILFLLREMESEVESLQTALPSPENAGVDLKHASEKADQTHGRSHRVWRCLCLSWLCGSHFAGEDTGSQLNELSWRPRLGRESRARGCGPHGVCSAGLHASPVPTQRRHPALPVGSPGFSGSSSLDHGQDRRARFRGKGDTWWTKVSMTRCRGSLGKVRQLTLSSGPGSSAGGLLLPGRFEVSGIDTKETFSLEKLPSGGSS